MTKLIQIFLIFLVALPLKAIAQDTSVDCYDLLEKAKHDFEIGKIDRVEDRVNGCLNRQLPIELRKQILELLIETALFLDDSDKAEKYYVDLKVMDPFATLNDFVPETRYLSNKFETFPSTTYSFHLGGTPNLKGINMDGTPPGVDLTDLSLKREKGDLFGWFAGMDAAFNIDNSKWDASIGYTFHKNYLYYDAELDNALEQVTGERGPASLSFREQAHWSQLTLGLVYQFNKRDRFEKRISPYLFVKLGGTYVHENSSTINEPELYLKNQQVLKTRANFQVSEMRNNFLVSAKAGAAVRVRLYRHLFFQGGLVYHRVLTNLAKENTESDTYNALINVFNFQDDDFTAHQLGFFGGFGYYLFKTKKK